MADRAYEIRRPLGTEPDRWPRYRAPIPSPPVRAALDVVALGGLGAAIALTSRPAVALLLGVLALSMGIALLS